MKVSFGLAAFEPPSRFHNYRPSIPVLSHVLGKLPSGANPEWTTTATAYRASRLGLGGIQPGNGADVPIQLRFPVSSFTRLFQAPQTI